MELWSGDVILDNSNPSARLQDIRLYAPSAGLKFQIGPDVTLSFLTALDPGRVPLHLVAGPSLEVCTGQESTEAWFTENILKASAESPEDSESLDAPWWEDGLQSDVGVLLKVDGELRTPESGNRITELLLYAALTLRDESPNVGIMTPPRSSSPDPEAVALLGDLGQDRAVKIYALPLSAPRVEPRQPTPLEETADGHACFLPPVYSPLDSASRRKRQRLETLFEDAVQQHKRSRRRGGESMAKTMASLDSPTPISLKPSPIEPDNAGLPEPARSSKTARSLGLSRAHSIGSLRDLEAARPRSAGRLGGAANKRSSLYRVTSASQLESSSPASDIMPGFDADNKNALSRLIMAGMRMYGLQQRKKPTASTGSRAASETPSTNAPTASTCQPQPGQPKDEDQYKLVYHQTLKAASFALRAHMSRTAIGQDAMRDTVDRLLAIFCTDPLESGQGDGSGFGSQVGNGQTDIFGTPRSGVLTVAKEITPRKVNTPPQSGR